MRYRSAPDDSVFDDLVADIKSVARDGFVRVGVDGVDGAGKSFFAAELGRRLEHAGLVAINVSVDGFHHPAQIRYRRGRRSPEGFYTDSYDYDEFIRLVLQPFGAGGDGRFVRAIHDSDTDSVVQAPVEQAPPGAILVVDGIFLHRDELVAYWDYSIFLDVGFSVSIPRMAYRDGTSPDPGSEYNFRYVAGQEIYIEQCRPAQRASVVIDNSDLEHPRVLRRGPAG